MLRLCSTYKAYIVNRFCLVSYLYKLQKAQPDSRGPTAVMFLLDKHAIGIFLDLYVAAKLSLCELRTCPVQRIPDSKRRSLIFARSLRIARVAATLGSMPRQNQPCACGKQLGEYLLLARESLGDQIFGTFAGISCRMACALKYTLKYMPTTPGREHGLDERPS